MEILNNKNQCKLTNNNLFLGTFPQIKNSKIIFYGSNNILFCNNSVVLQDSTIEFCGNNSIIFLMGSNHNYKISIKIFHDSVIYFDSDSYFNESLDIVVSEKTNLIVGKDCMFSKKISIMTSDHHPIYDINSLKRLNHPKSIYIGDHVWVGQNATILKGTMIDSGSIIGASSLVSGIFIKNNSIYAGNPAILIKKNIFWDGFCSNKFELNNSRVFKYNKSKYIDYVYFFDKLSTINYNYIDNYLKKHNIMEKYQYLLKLSSNFNKNRFVHL